MTRVDDPEIRLIGEIIRQAREDYRLRFHTRMRDPSKLRAIERNAKTAEEFLTSYRMETLLGAVQMSESIDISILRRNIFKV